MSDLATNATLVAIASTTTLLPPSTSPNTSLATSSVGDKAVRATFLALFIIFGFVGNCVLIATISFSARLKSSSINLCILSLAIANILDSAANMPLILGATITEKWDYGILVCQLNAFGIQLVSIVAIVGLMVLSLDRMLAVQDPDKHNSKIMKKKMSIVIAFSWIHAIAFSIPIMLDSVVPIKVFSVRYLCTISNNTPLVYLVFTSICAYLIPILLCLGFFFFILHRGIKERKKDKELRSRQGYIEGSLPRSKVWAEIEGAKYTVVIFILWCMLQGPYLVLSSITWYRNSTELSEIKEFTDFLSFKYPWELELALTWLKLSYPVFLPAVTFLWKKEVWKKFKNCILCRKSNLVIDASPNGSPQHNSNSRGVFTASASVPVIFATENGLHFQTYNDDDNCSDEIEADAEDKENSTTQVITKKCDVYGSQDFLQLDEDTSDYDSSGEIDPFSNSNPLSVRTEYGRQRSHNSSNNSKVSFSTNRTSLPSIATTDSKPQDAASEKSPVKEKRNRVRLNSSSSSIRDRTIGEGNAAFILEENEDVEEEPQAASINMERRSHDSGMGSLDKYKKVARRYKNKSPADGPAHEDQDVKDDPTIADSKESKPQELTQDSAAATVKRKRRSRQSTSSETDAIKHDSKENGQSTFKKDSDQSARPLPLPRKERKSMSELSESGESVRERNVRSSKVDESKSKPTKSSETNGLKSDSAKSASKLSSPASDSTNTKTSSARPKSKATKLADTGDAKTDPVKPSSGASKTLDRKDKVTEIVKPKQPSTKSVETKDTKVKPVPAERKSLRPRSADSSNDIEMKSVDTSVPAERTQEKTEDIAVAPVKPKKKKKKKILDTEVRRKQLAAELDEEIQGVIC